ncbi:hypothetical protein HYPSUDRAFT_55123 [Hypholoma sublateritium FD-334 SS-4]|uniref:Mug135-like C-terminal domain-containing protein n=1 Tax=Hypholoma sublateritium (strain FD-334 SS-4) TaxID=945553 RepID=A0A0D2L526_HYPSF|nr:hypothetical protein HYPSUDRAFT_55123 [Hypholoma sublateritium FD-334 SS-4]
MVDVPNISPASVKYVNVPKIPTNPPTFEDITTAISFSNHLFNELVQGHITNHEDVVKGALYREKLLATQSGGEPTWFAAAIARELEAKFQPLADNLKVVEASVNALKQDMKAIGQDVKVMGKEVKAIKKEVEDLKKGQAQIRRIAAITFNKTCGTGPLVVLQVVPFTNGEDPLSDPYNLPQLVHPGNVAQLSTAHRDQYCKGYYPGRLPPAATRTAAILTAIGASV